MHAYHVILVSFVASVVFRTVVCERDNILYCGACIALIEEINWQTGITDPKKKLQIGNFQLDAKGNMKAREVQWKRSEVHLTEVMEVVCRYMHYYTKHIDFNGNTNYIRTASRDGSAISKKFTEEITDIRNTLQFACDYVLEHHEDELMRIYQAGEEEVAEKLCADISGLCTRQNVSDQLWAYASAVMLGLSEQAAEKGDSSAESLFKKVEDGDNVEDHDDDLGNDEDDLSADDNEQNSAADEVREEIDKARFERTDL